ncbi:unnamed protein product [Cunninghamella blakesleeana]
MKLQELPPEIIYSVLHFLPSPDITSIALTFCQPLYQNALIIMAERAKESMESWKLRFCAVLEKVATENNNIQYQEEIYYSCEFSHIDQNTMEFFFTIKKIEDDEYNNTPMMDKMLELITPSSLTIKKGSILMPFGSTLSLEITIVKEKISTQVLEYATTLDCNLNISADNYKDLTGEITKIYDHNPDFKLKYEIKQLEMALDEQQQCIPNIVFHFDSLRILPNWWWNLLKEHGTIHPIFGLEHAFW